MILSIPKQVFATRQPGSPGMKFFAESKFRQGDYLVFPQGFSQKEATTLAKSNAMAFRFLAKLGLIPPTIEQAEEFITSVMENAYPVAPEVMRAMIRGGRPLPPNTPTPVLERRTSATPTEETQESKEPEQ
jgi:hypothetical protein